eukprot:7589653-Pyramimonas_sp.AAC.1
MHIASSSGSMGRTTATRIPANGVPTGPEDQRKRNKAPDSGCGHALCGTRIGHAARTAFQ